VKSNGTFRDILMQEAPGVWRSNRSAPGKQGTAALQKIVEKVIALEEAEGGEPNAQPATSRTNATSAGARQPRSARTKTKPADAPVAKPTTTRAKRS
jgi:hypothetical protein